MNKNSIIVSCAVWIMFVIMSATAILSPHGSYASTYQPTDPPFTTPTPGDDNEPKLTIQKSETEFHSIRLGEMPTFGPTNVNITIDGENTVIRGVELRKLLVFSGLNIAMTGKVSVLGFDGAQYEYDLADINQDATVYACYAFEDGTFFDSAEDGGLGNFLIVDFNLPGDQWCVGAETVTVP